ncbi:8926_t:CDS:2 [Funneliformis caledonium]|uniref:8926_t:CDS:1 n=1 Tax=Funneliformis caledonium TaxID=1117310 RepID=A0A9N9CLM6_9GLOM|nr:8926_t:CDS:2 [Funneliformis caledonium]
MSDKTKVLNKSKIPDKLEKFLADRFQDIDSTSLALYKVEFVADSVIIQTLKKHIHSREVSRNGTAR